MDAPVRQQLLKTLAKIDRPGIFCTSGPLPPTLPGLEVAGVGPVALPLEKRQAAALKKRAHQAPYGKGTQTLVDTDVRRVWETDADRVVLANPQWRDVVKQAVAAAVGGNYDVDRPEQIGNRLRSLTGSFEMALAITGFLSVLVGSFLVYNAVAVAVAQRRREVGILRALGEPRPSLSRRSASMCRPHCRPRHRP